MNVQNSLNELPSENLSYPISKSITLSSTFILLPGLLALMYICLNNPQNTRKQNGNYGISISRSRTALLQLKKVRKDAPLFTWSRAEPAGTFHIYYLKTLYCWLKTGNGVTAFSSWLHGCQEPPAPDADVLTKLLESWTVNEKRAFQEGSWPCPPAVLV